MNTATAALYPLRLVRGTTGTVHAGREVQTPVGDFSVAYELRFASGETRTELVKACGYDANTMRRVGGVGVAADVEITCKKCLKHLSR